MDKEVAFDARITIRIMHEHLRKHASLYPQAIHYTYEAESDEDSPP
jgi:hypothetical protein